MKNVSLKGGRRRFLLVGRAMRLKIKYQVFIGVVLLFGAATAASQDTWKSLALALRMPKPMMAGYAPVNDIQMYYAIYGQGEPVLFIHGGLENNAIWAHQVVALSQKYQVIVADSRGHGKSSRPHGPYSYDLMTADYIALLDYLNIDRVAVVGSSDGGIIGLDLAMMEPERLTKVFAHAANASVDGLIGDIPAEIEAIEQKYEAQKALREKAIKIATTDSLPYEDFVLAINRMWYSQPNWSKAQLAAIKVPVTIALGEKDEAIRRDHTEYMAKTIPGAKLVILPKVGHAAMLQDPERFTKAVLEFLERPAVQ
jgi:pimeloyl-ACP methyl ester carboxylesterase